MKLSAAKKISDKIFKVLIYCLPLVYFVINLLAMTAPLIIRNKDIQKIYNCSPATATRKLKLVKDVLNKRKHHVVTLHEFCDYYDIPESEVTHILTCNP